MNEIFIWTLVFTSIYFIAAWHTLGIPDAYYAAGGTIGASFLHITIARLVCTLLDGKGPGAGYMGMAIMFYNVYVVPIFFAILFQILLSKNDKIFYKTVLFFSGLYTLLVDFITLMVFISPNNFAG